jgi:hypothetical protein
VPENVALVKALVPVKTFVPVVVKLPATVDDACETNPLAKFVNPLSEREFAASVPTTAFCAKRLVLDAFCAKRFVEVAEEATRLVTVSFVTIALVVVRLVEIAFVVVALLNVALVPFKVAMVAVVMFATLAVRFEITEVTRFEKLAKSPLVVEVPETVVEAKVALLEKKLVLVELVYTLELLLSAMTPPFQKRLPPRLYNVVEVVAGFADEMKMPLGEVDAMPAVTTHVGSVGKHCGSRVVPGRYARAEVVSGIIASNIDVRVTTYDDLQKLLYVRFFIIVCYVLYHPKIPQLCGYTQFLR